MPADDDLRRGFAVLVRQLANDLLVEDSFTALGQRAPGFGLDLMGRVPGMKLTLLQQRMQLNLVDHRRDASFVDQALQVANLEVTDADALHQPLLLKRNHPLPGFNVMIDSRYRPVHQVEINMIEFQLVEAGL